MENRRYIRVILPLRLEWEPLYSVPERMQVQRGDRVTVCFGRQVCTGVVSETNAVPDVESSKILNISEVRHDIPPVSNEEIRLWRFMADYYLCTVGEVFKAAYPALRAESEEAAAKRRLKEEQRAAEEAERQAKKAAAQAARKEKKMAALRERIEKKEAAIEKAKKDSTIERYKAELEVLQKELGLLAGGFAESGGGRVAKAGRGNDRIASGTECAVPACECSCGGDSHAAGDGGQGKAGDGGGFASACRDAADNEQRSPTLINRDGSTAAEDDETAKVCTAALCGITLSEAQKEACEEIEQGFGEGRPVLLHGVTGSGKTEIYLKAAGECLRSGGNVLYLVPEIALSHQLEVRLRAFFGDSLCVYHSAETAGGRQAAAERVRGALRRPEPCKSDTSYGTATIPPATEAKCCADGAAVMVSGDMTGDAASSALPICYKTGKLSTGSKPLRAAVTSLATVSKGYPASARPYVLLGTRSAVFLPYHGLGLIIVDEEHDSSYKQDSPAPRYNARDTAVALAKIQGANIILGSATPSFESLYNCEIGRFRLVRLRERYYESPDSTVEVIDTTAERRKNGMVGDFSIKLIGHIRAALNRGEQVAILRARRAWAPIVTCRDCGDSPRCPRCNVTMSYHFDRSALVCHYCGHTEAFTGRCRKCGGALLPLGAGTQKIEDELRELFPEARVARLDSDTGRSRTAEKALIKSFEEGKTDILVGTQMVAKGFDFKGLTLVAVIQADSLTGRQDFRADERAVQLLEQLRGRSGRRGQRGLFVIQTAQASHPVYQGLSHGQEADLRALMEERRLFGYPPYSHIILLTVKDFNQKRLTWLSGELHRCLVEASDCEVTAPYAPAVDKVAGQYLLCIRVMIPKDIRQGTRKKAIKQAVEAFEKEKSYTGHIAIDVDPA